MFNHITQWGMAKVAEGDSWETVSQVPPDMNNFGKVTSRYFVTCLIIHSALHSILNIWRFSGAFL